MPTPAHANLPLRAGIGLRAPHVRQVLDETPQVAWFEVHSENFFADGGPALETLSAVRACYPVSLHGVGMSLGTTDPLDERHLHRLRELVRRIEPAAVSEHLCWSNVGGRWYNDLLPLPYSHEALELVSRNVQQVQETLCRRILVENISSYLRFHPEEMPEWDFLAALARRTGCGLLLDVNNIHVSSRNHGFDPQDYLDGIPREAVCEIHLAGYEEIDGLLIDTHSRPVQPDVWQLYERALSRFGPRPTLIEWDQDIPPLAELMAEAGRAQSHLDAREETCHAIAA